MAGRPKRWISVGFGHAIQEFELSSWRYFSDFVRDELLDYPQFIYRGHASVEWTLESSLDRLLRNRSAATRRDAQSRHLASFKAATRGRRGVNPAKIDDENEWWALGQHQGLATPLLDWTSSPFVASYFAYEEPFADNAPRPCVFALDQNLVDRRSRELSAAHKGEGRAPTIEFVRPTQDENARLVSQGGLFTRAPDGETIEQWTKRAFENEPTKIALIKLTMPSGDRSAALRMLNRMNINRASLFPDLAGASAFCNMAQRIFRY